MERTHLSEAEGEEQADRDRIQIEARDRYDEERAREAAEKRREAQERTYDSMRVPSANQ